MSTSRDNKDHNYRTIWISDVHLGFKGCRAEFLLDFLKTTNCDRLYLVGDIIDVWNMKRGLYWPQTHNNVVRKVLGMAKNGTEVIFVPGNHDEVLRDFNGSTFGNIHIRNEVIHESADGKKYLILHGDEFDSVVKCSKLLAILGNHAYEWLLAANRWVNIARRKLGFPYWSLAAYLKQKVKNAMMYISQFETAVAHEAERRGADGVICGHIHHAEISTIGDVMYFNTGDWVESCTALVEHHDGALELLHWSDKQHSVKATDAVLVPVARDAA